MNSTAAPVSLSPVAKALLLAVRGYQLTLSPFLGSQCRFLPTCSHYAMDAIRVHGAAKGMWLGTRRLARCHPWCDGGFDPVPGIPDRATHS
jgi:hypothetical protein